MPRCCIEGLEKERIFGYLKRKAQELLAKVATSALTA